MHIGIGTRLTQLRLRYKLNQSQLGELCGVTKAAVSQWEKETSMPEISKLIKLRSKLFFSLDWLITGEEEVMLRPVIERRQYNRRQWNRRFSDRFNIL
ncbi:helix-turn-helix domain-containing protein [Nitrosovibrio sp. Nv6]|uniref:helix-turn-helix domain-containing protein n=1 Tax=Nitrosovibrio sp. Nv6 TaxID=1855340 RepID=UPI0008C28BD8|nr:helix-turn-helix transcriptional regulator [Nitrosovibrio sp. Nv6]SEP37039.1 Transcriptional regulator, contains XRE-family HTH domain [Nitrosovibrio sp. Nv6]